MMGEWQTTTLSEIVEIGSGKAVKYSKDNDFVYDVYGSNGKLGTFSDYNFTDGFLIGRVGAVGTVHQISRSIWASDNTLTIKVKDNTITFKVFLKYMLIYLNLEKYSTKTAQPLLTQNTIKKVKINLPPLNEQQKIAAILSSVDEAIEKTEQIIEKIELVKKGLMQVLFTKGIGHVEFKHTLIGDIPLSWELVQTAELFESSSLKNNEHLEVLSVTQDEGVVMRKNLDINIKYDKKSLKNYKKVVPGNFIISLRSFQGGLEVSKYEGIVSPAYTVLKNKINIDENYFKYFFKSFWFIEQLKSSTIGIRDGKQISYQDFKLIKIPLPPLKEQMRIANIINQLERKTNFEATKLLKLSSVKQGLMQQLLTGKKRVKVDDSEEVLS